MSLPRLLERAARPTLLLARPGHRPRPSPPGRPCPTTSRRTSSGRPSTRPRRTPRWGCVVVAVADRAALRRDVETVPRLGRTRAVVTFLAEASAPLVPDVRPEWPEPGGARRPPHLRRRCGHPAALPLGGRRPRGAGPARRRRRLARHRRARRPRRRAATTVPRRRCRRTCCAAGRRADSSRPSPAGAPSCAEPRPGRRRRGRAQPDRLPTRRDRPPCVDLPARAGSPSRPWPGCARPGRCACTAGVDGVRRGRAGDGRGPAASPDGPLPTGLDPALGALVESVDAAVLDDPLAREEHSVRLRRAAAAAHSLLAERLRLGQAAGVRVAGLPTVSVVLATRRPEQLDFALTQVAKQSGADLELVLAPHGFDVDPRASCAPGWATGPSSSRPAPADALLRRRCSPRPPRRPRATWCSRWTTTTGTAPTSSPTCSGRGVPPAPSSSACPPSSSTSSSSASPCGAAPPSSGPAGWWPGAP